MASAVGDFAALVEAVEEAENAAAAARAVTLGEGHPRQRRLLYLIRHAEGEHQLRGGEKLVDPDITRDALKELRGRRRQFQKLLRSVELVVSSPLRRALQTAVTLFREEGQDDDIIGERSSKPAEPGSHESAEGISTRHHHVGLVAVPQAREEMTFNLVGPGLDVCNLRRGCVTQLRTEFPCVNFEKIAEGADVEEGRAVPEKERELQTRAQELLRWLREERSEAVIVVCSHLRFLAVLEYLLREPPGRKQEGGDAKPVVGLRNAEIRGPFPLDKVWT